MNRGNLRVLVFTSLAHFVNDGYALLFPILITYYDRIPGLQLWILGDIAIIYTLTSGFVSTPASMYADRKGIHKQILLLGILMDGISAPFLALPFMFAHTGYFYMIIGAIFLGVGQSLYHPMGAYLISDSFGIQSSPTAMGLNGSFGSLGRASFPGLTVLIVSVIGKFIGINFIGAIAILSGILISIGLSAKRVTEESTIKYRKVTKPKLATYRRFIIPLTTVTFFRSMTLSSSITYVPAYLSLTLNSQVLMGAVMTVSLATAIIGQPFFGRLTTMRGGRFSVTITVLLGTIAFLAFLSGGKSPIMLTISFAAYSFFAMSAFPVFLGYTSQVVPKEISATTSGIIWGVGNTIGGAVGIGLTSYLLMNGFSIYRSLWVLVIFTAIATVLLPSLPKKDLNLSPS